MSIRHPAFCSLVEHAACDGIAALTDDDRDLLAGYADADASVIEDQLDGVTRELVEELTGRDDVWSPRRASRALLALALAEA